MANEQSIRITARGEFGQLQRGLKSLQSDLKNVIGEIDRGARRGGIFDESQLRALELFRRRFKDTMGELEREFERQNRAIDELHKRMSRASGEDKKNIREQIMLRERELDVLRRQLMEIERIYNRRNQEASTYRTEGAPGGGEAGGGAGGAGLLSLVLGRFGGAAKFALGMTGIGGILALAQDAYQQAFAREVNSLDLAQRLRGYGFGGSATSIYDQVSAIGRRDRMGYTAAESWMLQDVYTQRAGTLGVAGQYALQRFARGYGLDATVVGGTVAGIRALGGVSSPEQFTDLIAASVAKSGMTPRILEVMETHTGLLEQLNTTFKEGSSRQILAYQTILDRAGNRSGMMGLTGQAGASIIAGLGGIFAPGSDKWKWLGIEALQKFNPQKYGNMGLYELERAFEDGLVNTDNLPAMVQLLRAKFGGNTTYIKRGIQQWLIDGGYNATKRQVDDLFAATNGFTDFSKANIEAIMNAQGDGGAKYAERMGERGQGFLDTEARFQKALEGIGSQFVGLVQGLKEATTTGLELINGTTNLTDAINRLNDLFENYLRQNGLMPSGGVVESVWNAITGSGTKDKKLAMQEHIQRLKEDPVYARLHAYQQMYARDPWGTNPVSATGNAIGDKVKSGARSLIDALGLTEALEWLGNLGGLLGDDNPLEKLESKGTQNIKEFQTMGNRQIGQFKDESSRNIRSMKEDTSKHMSAIATEHKSFLQRLSDWFMPTAYAAEASMGIGGDFGSGTLVEQATKLIMRGEGGYSSVNQNDSGALSIGKFQWHGNRARDLLARIAKADPATFRSIMGDSALGEEVLKGADFSSRTLSAYEAGLLEKLLNTPVGRSIQDQLAASDVSRYLQIGRQYGVTDSRALAYFADLYNQSPLRAIEIAKRSNGTLSSLHQLALADPVMGRYSTRRNNAFAFAGSAGITDSSFIAPTVSMGGTGRLDANVSIHITGEGANQLNSMSRTALEQMVRKVIIDISRQNLQLNPTRTGWGG